MHVRKKKNAENQWSENLFWELGKTAEIQIFKKKVE